MEDRIVITGVGAITPLGLSEGETWVNIIHGKSGLGLISRFDTSPLPIRVACEVKNFDPQQYLPPKEIRRRDRYQIYAAAAVREALVQSGLSINNTRAERVGVSISTAIGGLESLVENINIYRAQGLRKVTPLIIPMLIGNGAAGLVGIDHGFSGPAFSVTSACASGADGIGMAFLMLRYGMLDAAICGASEATITDVGIVAFERTGAMSHLEKCTPQPFDRNRDGLIMGEGAAVMVLERESHARNRGVEILAELVGYASTADAYHITAPPDDGAGGARAMRAALEVAGLCAEDVDYVNAHGTATHIGDVAETRAIKSVFGLRAYRLPISSTKSMTGHMMSATGALEALFCIRAIREGILPPTINYQTPDPECDLDYIPNKAREQKINIAMSNSFGFGGHNAVLILRAYQ